jgi:hypothetical protein
LTKPLSTQVGLIDKHNHEFRFLTVNSVLDHPWRYFLRCGGLAKRAVLRPVGA